MNSESVLNSETVTKMEDETTKLLMEFQETYLNHGENEAGVSIAGNDMIGDVELPEPTLIEENADSEWMGYSELELGFLSPEKMPNCITEDNEGNSTIPVVIYDGEPYYYVNDYITELERAAAQYGVYDSMGPVIAEYKKYANVWVTSEEYGENIKVLGGLEEYGKYCAGKGAN